MRSIAGIFVATLLMTWWATGADGVEDSETRRLLQELREELRSQRQEIQWLKEQLRQQNTAAASTTAMDATQPDTGPVQEHPMSVDEIAADVDRPQGGFAAIKEVTGVNLSKGIDGLTLKGDVRFRYEAREIDAGGADLSRDRWRTRLRLGGVWTNTSENWEVGAGLATGGADGLSTNDTWSEAQPFETGDIRLDYGYARHSWEHVDLGIGQVIQPWEKQTTYMLWDGDVRPTGIHGQYQSEGAFVRAGWFPVQVFSSDAPNGENADADLINAQVGYDGSLGDGIDLAFAGGLWYYGSQAWEATSNSGATARTVAVDSFPAIAVDLNNNGTIGAGETGTRTFVPGKDEPEWFIGDVYGKLTIPAGEKAKLMVHGHYARNMDSDFVIRRTTPGGGPVVTTDIGAEDTAWLFGGGVEIGPLSVGLDYTHIEAGSVYPLVKDSDFGETGGGTVVDVEGLKGNVTYKFAKSLSLGATYMDLQEIKGNSRDSELVQVDLTYKF